ncbi:DUF192 domain-containing protein [Nodosilinea sp. PGN35]|uniref:DUF192 domain-containing protein n=1 Tax=Nodosilinea sp. PGN35 TaxID=3020489 RepID=UPI0023B33259|nr:DUF192 domain-containing protein [Nodosilinea sp. TSF1-S3]MDF0369993.1 DUF192 domain-containing protein [Nodosilinea sp. TSF1-S3]
MSDRFTGLAPQRLYPWLRQGVVLSLVLSALVLGAGCGPTPSATEPPATTDNTASTPTTTATPMADPRGQQLAVTAVTTLGGEEIFLEVAATPQQQALGLMYRDALPGDRGMLFPMGRPRPVSFWMKNVPVALDMVFVYQGQIVGLAEAPPCTADPCPTYGPGNQLVDQVIELRAGRAAELGLAVGDEVVIRELGQ